MISNDGPLNCLQPIQYELMSFLVYPEVEYYSKIAGKCAKFQLMLHDWHRYAVKHSKLKRSLNMIKTQICTLNMDQFMELLFNVQPWMTHADLMEILQFSDLEQHNAVCQGGGSDGDLRRGRQIWVCHISIKVLLLTYFVADWYKDDDRGGFKSTFYKVITTMHRHRGYSCWMVLDSGYQSIHRFGNHIVEGHVLRTLQTDMEKHTFDEADALFAHNCREPPIVSIHAFQQLQTHYMKGLIKGYRIMRDDPAADGITFLNELGKPLLLRF